MNFFKSILASLIGFWLAIIVVIIIVISITMSFTEDEVVEITDNSILELNFKESVKDYVSTEQDAFKKILDVDKNVGFNQIIKVIKRAKKDDKIKAISIKKLPVGLGWAQTTELRNELKTFKQTGKKVWAYNDTYSQKNYYLSSIADTLAMAPIGSVELNGLHSEVLFFKDFQEKYGVKMEVVRHGKYKSAVESFIANKISEENEYQISELINSIWGQLKQEVGSSRSVNADSIANNLFGNLPKSAFENDLVDALWYEDDFNNQFKKSILGDTKIISFNDYMQNDLSALKAIGKKNKIAVIYAQGEIIYGEGDENKIGQELMIKAITKAVENEKVKAIVLRINSPGGSALASDLIWNAIEKAKKQKPIVVSMGNLAASGGYYIACNANKIYAEPTTITGSIGVFGVLPNASKFLNKNGVNSEVVSTHDNNSNYSIVSPVKPEFKNHVKESIKFVYSTFVNRVAQGRNMNFAQVDSLAQGRVWTGVQAKNIGLVDELGGLKDAVAHAATLAEVSEFGIKEYPNYEMNFQSLLGGNPLMQVFKSSQNSVTKQTLSKLEQLQQIFEMEGVQARMPFEIEME